MKLRSVLLFSTVIASLTFVVIAYADEVEIGFEGGGYFGMYPDGDFWVFFPYPGPDLLNVSPLGLSEVDWEIRVTQEFVFVDGWFTITGPNGRDSLMGYYEDFVLNSDGTYDLEWVFTGGTGWFDDFVGIGHTDGLANLSAVPPYAEFVFSGTVTDDDDNQGDDD